VYIEGSLRTDKYQDKKTGEDRYSTGIIANNLQLLGSRNDNASGGFQQQSGAAPAQNTPNQQPAMATASGAEFDDDIPF